MARYSLRKQFGLGDVLALFLNLCGPDDTMTPIEDVELRFLSFRECFDARRRNELREAGFEEIGIDRETRILPKRVDVFEAEGRKAEALLTRAYYKEAGRRHRSPPDPHTIAPHIRWRLPEFVRGCVLGLSEDASSEERGSVLASLLHYFDIACAVLREDRNADPTRVVNVLDKYLTLSPTVVDRRVRWPERDRLWRMAVGSFQTLERDWQRNERALKTAISSDISLTAIRSAGNLLEATVFPNVPCIVAETDSPNFTRAARSRGAKVVVQVAEHGNRILVSADRQSGTTEQVGLVHVAAVLRMADAYARLGGPLTDMAQVFAQGLPSFGDAGATFVLGETEASIGNLDASLPESALSKEKLLWYVQQALSLDVSDLGPTFPADELYGRPCSIALEPNP